MKIKMQWVISEHRKNRKVGAISPVKASRYYKYLAEIGAGFNDKLGR